MTKIDNVNVLRTGKDAQDNIWTKEQLKNMYLPEDCPIFDIKNNKIGEATNIRKEDEAIVCDVELDAVDDTLAPLISYEQDNKDEILELQALINADQHAFEDLEGNIR